MKSGSVVQELGFCMQMWSMKTPEFLSTLLVYLKANRLLPVFIAVALAAVKV